jgi:hypothetical protein
MFKYIFGALTILLLLFACSSDDSESDNGVIIDESVVWQETFDMSGGEQSIYWAGETLESSLVEPGEYNVIIEVVTVDSSIVTDTLPLTIIY